MKNSIDELSELIYQKKEDIFLSKIKDIKINIDEFNSTDISLLHLAALVEDSDIIIKNLIKLGSNINIKDSNGNTPVIYAANYNCPNNIKTLIKYNADLSLYNIDLNTPLHIACSGNNIIIAKILIENKAEINSDNGNLQTPLIKAIDSNTNFDLIEMLLNYGADINYGNGNGTSLMSAISYENIPLVKFLISKGAKIKGYKNKSGEDTITFAKRVGNNEIIDYLIECLKR
ncbi:ankyrin repeat domain-containing protein [Flavobacterium sp. LS1R49]|uniref:Ankyrin repeat domain-containing protein n=1 Tax=Flavobacterium shii TaxID=2987687 RepID=A0A9X3C863_9FLAO|nr:ankyrin repeat domain-containing protein [Flavobacterium shii]MCV9930373.1 ankyrin repeat domain-containing protein [Flavobacterium shii]